MKSFYKNIHLCRNKSKHILTITRRNLQKYAESNIEKQTLKSSSTVISFSRDGEKDSDLIFVTLHGGPGSHKDFRYFSKALTDNIPSCQLIRYDLPGYADSERGGLKPTSKEFADRIIESLTTLDVLGYSSKKVIIIGHSLGSHIATDVK